MAHPGGRPSIYTIELGKEICSRIALGESVLHIVQDESMPASSTIYLWLLDEDKKEFSDNYAKARNIQAELMFEELLDIADDSSEDVLRTKKVKDENTGEWVYLKEENKEFTNRSRLRVDTRKWYLSKVLPKKFGDKTDITSDGKPIPLLHVIRKDEDK